MKMNSSSQGCLRGLCTLLNDRSENLTFNESVEPLRSFLRNLRPTFAAMIAIAASMSSRSVKSSPKDVSLETDLTESSSSIGENSSPRARASITVPVLPSKFSMSSSSA